MKSEDYARMQMQSANPTAESSPSMQAPSNTAGAVSSEYYSRNQRVKGSKPNSTDVPSPLGQNQVSN